MEMIAFYMHDFSGGGVERMRLALIAELRSRGLQVCLIVEQASGALRGLVPDDLPVIALNSRGTISSILPLVRTLRRLQPSILVSSLDHNNVAAMLAGTISGDRTRVIICQHSALSAELQSGWKYRVIPAIYRLLQNRADAIVAVSRGVADDLAVTAHISRSRITHIYNPVVTVHAPERRESIAPHPWLAADRDRPVCIFVGRLTWQKDPGTLLSAIARMQCEAPVRLIMLGEGTLLADLRGQTSNLGISDIVDFVGFQSSPQTWIAHADCLVSSSRYEGLGNVLIESLACGTPVVATNCPHGPSEILQGGEFGQLVPVGDAKSLALAIKNTLSSKPDRDRLRARANDFSAAACADAHLALFAKIKHARRQPRPATARERSSATEPMLQQRDVGPDGSAIRARPNKLVFGLNLSSSSADQVVDQIFNAPATDTLKLVVTPNIDHIRLLRRAEFAAACRFAQLVCPDGWPVLRYANIRGSPMKVRVTGCHIITSLCDHPNLASRSCLIVTESSETENTLRLWANQRGLDRVQIVTAPARLLADTAAQGALVATIVSAAPDIVVLTLGAPVSETFAYRFKDQLPPCWVLCVGQAMRVHAQIIKRAPLVWQRCGLEWAWRIAQEPKRLGVRYLHSAAWFPIAICLDLLSPREVQA